MGKDGRRRRRHRRRPNIGHPAAIAARCSRASGSFHCQGWRGEHQGYVRRAGRYSGNDSQPVAAAEMESSLAAQSHLFTCTKGPGNVSSGKSILADGRMMQKMKLPITSRMTIYRITRISKHVTQRLSTSKTLQRVYPVKVCHQLDAPSRTLPSQKLKLILGCNNFHL